MTRDELLTAINKLSRRITSELSGQEACDRLEAQMDKLQTQLEATTKSKE